MEDECDELMPLLQSAAADESSVFAPLGTADLDSNRMLQMPSLKPVLKTSSSRWKINTQRSQCVSFDLPGEADADSQQPPSSRPGSSRLVRGSSGHLALDSPGVGPSPRTARAFSKFNTHTKVKLQEIRISQLVENAEDPRDGPSLEMPEVLPGFESEAHLRDDAYWDELLGSDKHTRYPCAFVEGVYFQAMACFTILLNTVLLNWGIVSEWDDIAQQVVLVISLVEFGIIFRRRRAGVKFADNEAVLFFVLECIAIASCCFEMWALPLIVHVAGGQIGEVLTNVSPFIRVMWLLRMVRLIQLVPPLHELVHGLMDALQGLLWVLTLMTLLLYGVSIVCTRLVGHNLLKEEHHPKANETVEMFSCVGRSMFTLFMIMSSWSLQPLMPLMETAIWARFVFIAFYIFCGWTVLAVMTGTVSFHMMMSKTEIHSGDEDLAKLRIDHLSSMLDNIFLELDQDGNGELCYDEFKFMLRSKELLRTLAEETTIDLRDLEDMWEWLDEDGRDRVATEDFKAAFLFLNEPFTQKTVFKLQENIAQESHDSSAKLRTFIRDIFEDLMRGLRQPVQRMNATTEQVQVLDSTAMAICERVGVPPNAVSVAAARSARSMDDEFAQPDDPTIFGFERRIGEEIAKISKRLDRFRIVTPDGLLPSSSAADRPERLPALRKNRSSTASPRIRVSYGVKSNSGRVPRG
mmetsp:Transcript_107147/g.301577  ORF Transcript_107147/g.301577 Transcript_107147/m.301577 type:complete len:692 (+) Transcript_107147:165-2240(+)